MVPDVPTCTESVSDREIGEEDVGGHLVSRSVLDLSRKRYLKRD